MLTARSLKVIKTKSCPCVGLTQRLGRVGSRFFSFWWVGLDWDHYSKSTKNLKGLCIMIGNEHE